MAEVITPQTHVARGATYIFIQGLLNAVMGVIYVWFLLHTGELAGQILFTEEDMGLFTLLNFILSISSSLGILALRPASVKYIASYLAEGRQDKARSVVTRVLWTSSITSIVVMTLLFIVGWLISTIYPFHIFQLLPFSAVAMIFYHQTQGFLQGLQKMRELALIGITYTMFHYSVAIILVYTGFGVLGIVVGWVSGLSLACFLALFITFRNLSFSSHAHRLKPLLSFSLPIYISTLLTLIINWVDQIFVLPFLGIDALGVYNLAVRASIVPLLVSTALGTSIFPKLSELHSTLGTNSLEDAFRSTTRYAALLGFPISLIVAILAYPIVILFATIRFAGAVLPLAVMCLASLPTILGVAILPTLYTLGRTRTASLIIATSILLEAVFAYVSLNLLHGGLPAAAVSRFVGALITFILGVNLLRGIIKVEFDREAIFKAAVASVVMITSILVLEFLRASISPNSYEFLVLRIRQLPIYAVIGFVVYLSCLLVLKTFKKRDLELLRDYLPTRFRWLVKILSRLARLD